MHTASQLTDAEVSVEGDQVVVQARVPVGIGLDLRLRHRRWRYRCRRDGDRMEFLGFERLDQAG